MSKRSAYIEKMGAQLREWNGQLDVLKARYDKKKADVKIDYYDLLDKAKKRSSVAQKQLRDIGDASEDTWEGMKDGFEKSWKELKSTMEKVNSRFK
ncbi:MAG: coiled coil domain-containing protein [Calditrichia bacterium]